jgi:uncharacterized protein YegL
MANNYLDLVEFQQNPERRCPAVLVLDTSASMAGKPIDEVNDGLRQFERDLKADALASLRVDVAVLTFGGGVQTMDVRNGGSRAVSPDAAHAFVTADNFTAPTLQASGDTPMGAAVRAGLHLLRQRKDLYKQAGIGYYRPWLILMSDGQPTDDDWEMAAADAAWEESQNGVIVFPVGVEQADLGTLGRFSGSRPPLKLQSIGQFGELFRWLSSSLSAVANSRPGEQAPLPPVSGWAVIDPN